jgi:predicted 3-demethylubiquinone-9 3-methyltransferase (glyoxalase superfamily)
MTIQGVTTYLWFDNEALEAAEFYTSLFPNSKMKNISYYQAGAPKPEGSVLTVDFEIFGREFSALNGGPQFPHSEAVSFQVACDTQEEIDRIWNTLVSNGGAESQCGWCKDRFGVNWQVIATQLGELLGSSDPEKSKKAWEAMMQMTKIVIADLS